MDLIGSYDNCNNLINIPLCVKGTKDCCRLESARPSATAKPCAL